ncbi:MAG: hypothetical protein IPF93_15110 [Saprospiraceae bacterium]|nr:hypothetical protein [Saprospiraceae bacterium]
MQRPIDPMIFYPESSTAYTTIRITRISLKTKSVVCFKNISIYFTGNPFEYYFIDENFEKAYASERQFATILMIASGWAIFIACLDCWPGCLFDPKPNQRDRYPQGAGCWCGIYPEPDL